MEIKTPVHGCAVLLAEDNPTNVALMQAVLKMLHCQVTVAANGLAAVTARQQGEHDLMLMDYHMPQMNGVEATQAIRAWEAATGQTPVPIIALTGNAMPDEVARCLAAGMNEVLTKPIDLGKMQDLIERVCCNLHTAA